MPTNPTTQTQPKATHKTCCCCGAGTTGVQWHNRDTGYGICPKCIRWMKGRNTSAAEMLDLYGVEGVHYMATEAA